MSNEIRIPVVGRLTSAPEIRFTAAGAAVVNFTVASNSRRFDKQANEWKDQPATLLRCSAWRELAENIAESLDKGDEVVLIGELTQREYETKEGEKRTVMEVQVEAVGPSLRWATAKPVKAARASGGGGFGQGAGWGSQGSTPAADPWATPAATDEPPF